MRYIFVSDIHGDFEKLTRALSAVDFDRDKDTLVSVGDAFDRGTENFKVLEFLVNLPNKILLYGNHCLRLKKLVDRQASFDYCDWSNGTIGTIEELSELQYDLEECIDILANQKTDGAKLLKRYFDLCHYAVEFSNLIATHAWLPTENSSYKIRDSWRNARAKTWYEATWAHSEHAVLACLGKPKLWPEKPLLIGHWHAFRLAENCYDIPRNYHKKIQGSHNGNHVDCSEFISNDGKLIAIDGCTTYDYGVVNTYILETDEIPSIY